MFAMVIYRGNMPCLFAVDFSVWMCHGYLPWLFFVYVNKPFFCVSKCFSFVNKPSFNWKQTFFKWEQNFYIYENFLINSVSLCYCLNNKSIFQKHPPRGVPRKRCSEYIQEIYRRTPMPKCDFNKVALQFYWNDTLALAWAFSCKFAAYFQNTFS